MGRCRELRGTGQQSTSLLWKRVAGEWPALTQPTAWLFVGVLFLLLGPIVKSQAPTAECSEGGTGRATLVAVVTEPALPGLRVSLFSEMHPDKRIAMQAVPLVPGPVEFSHLCPGNYVIELSASDCTYYSKRKVRIRSAETKRVKLRAIKHEIPCE
jgi:hypothetical protein